MTSRLPADVALAFVDCINRRDVDGLAALMTESHSLVVFNEPPLTGRDANRDAWQGYFTAYPEYLIYPRRIAANGDAVAIMGNTTGSHLGLSDEEELALTLIWVADVEDGKVSAWRLLEDTAENRAVCSLDVT